jgi:hypothetical protein
VVEDCVPERNRDEQRQVGLVRTYKKLL